MTWTISTSSDRSGATATFAKPSARTGRRGAATGIRAGLLLSAAVLALTGCVNGAGGGQPAESTGSVSLGQVRTDREPIAKRFPRLGDFVAVQWQGGPAGTGDGRVPGPTDMRIQALVVLRPDTLATTVAAYEWQPAPADWDAALSSELRAFLPAGGTWQVSEEYAEDVRTVEYDGTVYLDTAGGTVFLSVIDS